MLPEQGQSLATWVRSRANSRRHGVASGSARTMRPGYQTLRADCGYTPAPVATADGVAATARPVVATTQEPNS